MLADRMKTLAPSPTLAMQAKARAMRAQGIDVISFGAGEPDFDTPRADQGRRDPRAGDGGQTKYTEVGGVPELRAAVCQKLKRDHGLEYAPDEVTVSCGAKHTLYNIVMALVNPGDEVLIPSPYWVSYPEQVQLLGGVPVPVPTHESTGFDLDPAALRRGGHAAHEDHRARQPRATRPARSSPRRRSRRWRGSRSSVTSGSSPTSATSRSPTRAATSRSPRSRPRSRRAPSWSTRARRRTR